MIGVEFKGRLGNQLFQYCFLLYLKKQHPRYFYFFPNPHHTYITQYFDLGWYHNLTLSSKWYSYIMRLLPRAFKFTDRWFFGFVSPKPVIPRPWTINHGYWQTDWYFRHLDRKQLPKLKPKWKKIFMEKFGSLFANNKTIVVHIRLTDYKNHFKRDLSLPLTYYEKLLKKVEDLADYKVIFVSDDMETVQNHFGTTANYIYSSNDEIIDFQLIMHADIALIANSTFSWWAAYLSPKQHQRVFAPRNFLGFRIGREFPVGIMTDRFTWEEVV